MLPLVYDASLSYRPYAGSCQNAVVAHDQLGLVWIGLICKSGMFPSPLLLGIQSPALSQHLASG